MPSACWLLVLLTLPLLGGEVLPAPVRYGIDAGGFRVVVDLALPALPADQATRLEALVASTLPGFMPGQTFTTWVTTQHDQVLADHAALKAAFPAAASLDGWFDDTVIRTTWCGGGLICLHREQTSFTGGAHGNVCHAALLVDALTIHALTLDDLIRREDQAAFALLVSDTWRAANGLSPQARLRDHQLSVDELPAKLPLITATGIEVVYQPYEVGPYSTGTVRVALTRTQARPFLRRDPWDG